MGRSIQTSADALSQKPVRNALERLQISLMDFVLNSGGLAIKGAGEGVAKTVNTIYAMINGVLVTKAAADMAALSGTVTADKFNVFVFTMNASGTLKTTMGTEGDAIGDIVFPDVPAGEVVIGFVIINPTGTGNFVGGTTDLDDATVVPNAVYVNTPFPFNLNALSLGDAIS